MSATAPRRFAVRLLLPLVAAASLYSTGCLCTFERDWHAAQRCGIPCDNLAGLWEGTWESSENGHHGRLRAIITNCGNGQYFARYHATFLGCVPYSYDTTHTAVDHGAYTHFFGTEDLGCLAGGVYRYNGRADGMTFKARYRADKDAGEFCMQRVGACCGGPTCGASSPVHEPAPDRDPSPAATPAAPAHHVTPAGGDPFRINEPATAEPTPSPPG